MLPRSLTYDVNYGVDRRSGWTAVVDGRVIVQFRGFFRAAWAFVTGR